MGKDRVDKIGGARGGREEGEGKKRKVYFVYTECMYVHVYTCTCLED